MTDIAVLAVDVGTTHVRAAVVDQRGLIYGLNQVPTPRASSAGRLEPDLVWRRVLRVLTRARAAYYGTPRAICVSSQLGVCVLDDTGLPITAALTWEHRQATSEADTLAALVGRDGVDIGRRVAAEASGAQVLWLRSQEPGPYERISSVLSLKDYINYRLTGRIATDVVHAAYSALLDLQTRRWSDRLCAELGLPRAALPDILVSTDVLGPIRDRVATMLGVSSRTSVVVGAPDGTTAMIGLGVTRQGIAGDISGTSEVLFAYTGDRLGRSTRLVTNPHPDGNAWLVGGPMTAAGRSVAWIARAIGVSISRLLALASDAPAGSGGLLFMPGLGGDRTPFWDAAPRGAFVGLALAHDRKHLARATFEGVAFLTRRVVTECTRAGAPVDLLRLAGPSASSGVVRQLRADILGIPVEVASSAETGLLGSAALALTAIGSVSLERAVLDVQPNLIRHEPSETERSRYADLSDRWEETLERMTPDFSALADWRARYPAADGA